MCCPRPVCPGVGACVEPAVVWLRTEGERLVGVPDASGRMRLQPYLHRATEIHVGHRRGLAPLGRRRRQPGRRPRRQAAPTAGRRLHPRRQPHRGVAGGGDQAWFGQRRARDYKRDADPWPTRASVLAQLTDVGFAPTSRFARDEVLRSVHVFDAVIAAYVAYRRAREGWPRDDDACEGDGWIWVPPADGA
ncbi:MAG: hypothetical protein R2939_21685 [Kofleriaceae bacterium]